VTVGYTAIRVGSGRQPWLLALRGHGMLAVNINGRIQLPGRNVIKFYRDTLSGAHFIVRDGVSLNNLPLMNEVENLATSGWIHAISTDYLMEIRSGPQLHRLIYTAISQQLHT
jgi:hypothetical protein